MLRYYKYFYTIIIMTILVYSPFFMVVQNNAVYILKSLLNLSCGDSNGSLAASQAFLERSKMITFETLVSHELPSGCG